MARFRSRFRRIHSANVGTGLQRAFLIGMGSTSITDPEPKEIDISLGYNLGGFGITVTDYWWSGESKHYGYYKDNHYFEGALSYHFGEKFPLTISAATMFAGGDKTRKAIRTSAPIYMQRTI